MRKYAIFRLLVFVYKVFCVLKWHVFEVSQFLLKLMLFKNKWTQFPYHLCTFFSGGQDIELYLLKESRTERFC